VNFGLVALIVNTVVLLGTHAVLLFSWLWSGFGFGNTDAAANPALVRVARPKSRRRVRPGRSSSRVLTFIVGFLCLWVISLVISSNSAFVSSEGWLPEEAAVGGRSAQNHWSGDGGRAEQLDKIATAP